MPVQPAVKTFQPPTRQSPVQPVQSVHPVESVQPVTHDLANPQKSGVMRLPTVNFGQKTPNPQDKKETSHIKVSVGSLTCML